MSTFVAACGSGWTDGCRDISALIGGIANGVIQQLSPLPLGSCAPFEYVIFLPGHSQLSVAAFRQGAGRSQLCWVGRLLTAIMFGSRCSDWGQARGESTNFWNDPCSNPRSVVPPRGPTRDSSKQVVGWRATAADRQLWERSSRVYAACALAGASDTVAHACACASVGHA